MENINKCCLDERERLLKKYVECLPTDKALPLVEIGAIIEQMEDEYKLFLTNLWAQIKKDDGRTLDDILDKRYNRYIVYREYAKEICESLIEAQQITVWEQITNTNSQDIARLNALIYTYAKDLLAHITLDFMEDVK